MIDDEALGRIARMVHERYLAANGAAGTRAGAASWDELAAADRQQNIDQVSAFVRQLDAAGYDVVPGSGGVIEPLVLPGDVVERMAIAEHDRWMMLKMAQGYRYGPTRIDDPADLRHPDLIHWDDLDEAARDKDRRPMRDVPELLASAGFEVVVRRP